MKVMKMLTILAGWLLVVFSCGCKKDGPAVTPPEGTPQAEVVAASKPLYAFELEDMDGGAGDLAALRGKALLLVNVAGKCGYTPQYAGLQALYEKYGPRGFVVVGFPANNFGGQEPGTNEQIRQFCSSTYGVTFPVYAKISVKGDDIHPLYRFLTSRQSNPQFGGDIAWNFTKFLISREGDVVGRYESAVEPSDQRLVADIESALGKAG